MANAKVISLIAAAVRHEQHDRQDEVVQVFARVADLIDAMAQRIEDLTQRVEALENP